MCIRDSVITGIVVTYIGSSRRHALHMMRVNQKVSDLARLDALTGLANRRAFMDRLGAAFAAARRGAKPFAVLYFDLDHFKDINDTLGHAAGDELLHEVAAVSYTHLDVYKRQDQGGRRREA